MQATLEFKNVFVRYHDNDVLKDISCTLSHRRIAILGNNGSGKSTFAYCATNLLPIRKGSITYNGKDLLSYSKNLWKEINLTFQIPDQQILLPSVKEEIEFGLKNMNLTKDAIAEKTDAILKELDVSLYSSCHSLSAGKKRLLCLLCIVSLCPKTLILDEPTTFLDRASEHRMLDRILSLEQQIIIISHKKEIIDKMDYALCFHNGTIIKEGNVKSVLKKHQEL